MKGAVYCDENKRLDKDMMTFFCILKQDGHLEPMNVVCATVSVIRASFSWSKSVVQNDYFCAMKTVQCIFFLYVST